MSDKNDSIGELDANLGKLPLEFVVITSKPERSTTCCILTQIVSQVDISVMNLDFLFGKSYLALRVIAGCIT